MDSANSGSMQSSSGGDEEYDSSSHPHDNNFLLNHQTSTTVLNHLSANSSNPSAFLYSNDSYNNILNPFSHSPSTTSTSSLYNINNNNNIQDFWSSKPQTTTTTNIINITNSTSQNDQTPISTHQSDHHPLSQPPDHHNQSSAAPKNPKKRTRASRRAPTTVLTTDTTNFRQMVQEFTGIPAAPFSAATSAFSRRLDLFNTAARGESLIYPLRPSAQKVANMQQPSSSLYNMGDNSFANIATSLQQNAMNLQGNSMLNYQSMLQSQHQDQANTSQESSRNNIPILDDHDEVEHFGSFNATNVQLKDGGKGSY